MTTYSKWTIRVSLGYLLAGFTIGTLMLINKGFFFYPTVVRLLPLHMEYLMFGWFIHFIFGTAYWMFPRFTPDRSEMDHPRGFIKGAWTAFFLLNGGLLVFTASYGLASTFVWRFIGRLLELSAILTFILNLWPRTKPISR